MLQDTIERVNRLRQKAMSDPEFHKSAEEHAKTLAYVEQEFEPRRYRRKSAKAKGDKPKTLADIYQNFTIGENTSDTEH